MAARLVGFLLSLVVLQLSPAGAQTAQNAQNAQNKVATLKSRAAPGTNPAVEIDVETAQGIVTVIGMPAARKLYGAEKLSKQHQLPGSLRDLKWDRKMLNLDLEVESKYVFYTKRGGTSIGIKIGKRGLKKNSIKPKRKSAMFLPYSTSAIPEAEVSSYRLSRLLEVSYLFNPSTYYTLGPEATWRFKEMVRTSEYDQWRQDNADRLRRKLKGDDNSLFGVYKYRPKRRSQEVHILVWKNNFVTNHWLARYLKALGNMPNEKLVGLKGITRDKENYEEPRAAKLELARQLSTIFVIDMMIGQWDRFSGTNLEALAHKDGRLQFIARDNGGGHSSEDWEHYWKYTAYVSRFDQDLVDQLGDLNDFLQGELPVFKGFRDRDSLRIALGFRTVKSFENFVGKVKHFTQKLVPDLVAKHGKKVFFVECVKECQP